MRIPSLYYFIILTYIKACMYLVYNSREFNIVLFSSIIIIAIFSQKSRVAFVIKGSWQAPKYEKATLKVKLV